ncbi:BCAM0308 family protein [Azospirillum sp. ST 5-10]|uniref:BCAM0308 family protein n=1 Tax=unclassified Azospirillum TaxID=2630922 RepID=UPI003F4A73CC
MQRERHDHRPDPVRRDRLIQEFIHDPYKTQRKMADPAVCPRCGAVYETGRWHWGAPPAAATEVVCQACHRIADQCPAGILALHGGFVRAHRDELLAHIRHEAEAETAEHPLHRLMEIRDSDDGLEVTTTDVHLPRRIGEALRRTHQGDLEIHFDEGEYFARVRWQAG